MIFNIELHPAMLEVSPSEDCVNQIFGLALMLPVSGGAGPGNVLPLPLGTVRVPYSKEETQALIEKLQQAVEQIPDPEPEDKQGDILIAQSLRGVEEAAKLNQQMKKGQ